MIAAMLGVLLADSCVVTINPSRGESGLAADISELMLPALIGVDADWRRPGIAAAATGSLGLEVGAIPAVVATVRGLERVGPGPFRQEPDGVAVEMLTSGTTGPPKRIPLSYDAFEHTVAAAGAITALANLRICACVPASQSSVRHWCTCRVCSARC
jgi:acyl-CoA synthetase (AMP-forming)/AMP-acid ligase II